MRESPIFQSNHHWLIMVFNSNFVPIKPFANSNIVILMIIVKFIIILNMILLLLIIIIIVVKSSSSFWAGTIPLKRDLHHPSYHFFRALESSQVNIFDNISGMGFKNKLDNSWYFKEVKCEIVTLEGGFDHNDMTHMELAIPCSFDCDSGPFFYHSRKGCSLESFKLCFWPFPLVALCFLFSWLRSKKLTQSFNDHWWTNLEIHESPAQNEPSFPFRSGRNSNGTPWSPKLALNYFSFWVNEAPSALLTDKSISFQINLRKSYHISTPPFVITVNSRQAPKAD